MKDNYIHITLVIDESGSMYPSKDEVISGVKKIVDEQKKNKDGKVTLSLYKFNDSVEEVFVGKDINDFDMFEYTPISMTAMNDGIGTAIDKTGKWLADMKEEDRPSKVMVCIFTDGFENASHEYKINTVKEMISRQENVYNWTFLYLGTDITTSKYADTLGFKMKTYSSRSKLGKNYDIINSAVNTYRMCLSKGVTASEANTSFVNTLNEETTLNTKEYEDEIGFKISST